MVISSTSSSDGADSRASNQTRFRRGQPQKSHLVVDDDLSPVLPINEHNVGPVLEKLLAMMQSMSMLLSALKNDLRHSNSPEVVAKKRDAATMQLWRAFIAYQKSFSEIEQFAHSSRNCEQTAKKSSVDEPAVHLPSQSRVNQAVRMKSSRRSECLQVTDVIEVSESESDDDVECKRPRCDADENEQQSTQASVSSAAAVELSENTSLVATSDESSYAPSASASYTSMSSDTLAS